jgi:VanZ family protein
MALILGLSTDAGSAEHTGSVLGPLLRWLLPWATPLQVEALHIAIRKAGHVTAYAVLAGLWTRALVAGARWSRPAGAWSAAAIAVAWALLDEGLQRTRPSRTGSPGDVAIDAAGALAVALLAAGGLGPAVHRATVALLWIAAAGGAALLALDALTGTPSGPLWLTTPLAALALIIWRRQRGP